MSADADPSPVQDRGDRASPVYVLSSVWAEVAAFVAVLVVASWLVVRQLHAAATFDEGVYLNSLRLLESGYSLGGDVYASQPPGFYLLLRAASLVVPDSETSLRLVFMALTIAGFAAVYYIARTFGGFIAGALAMLLVAASPLCSLVGTHVMADGPAASVAAVGLAVAVAAWAPWRGAPLASLALSGLAGALVAFAISIKLSSVTAVAALAALYVLLRPPRRSVAALFAGGIALAATLVGVYWSVLPELWRDAVALHLHARGLRGSQLSVVGGTVGIRSNFWQIVHALLPKTTLASWFFVVGGAFLVATSWRNGRRALTLLVWPLVVGAFLLWQQPLFYHHVYVLAVAAAVPSGIGLARIVETGRRRDLLRLSRQTIAALALAALVVQASTTAIPSESAESGDLARVVAFVRHQTSPRDYVVASDNPLVAFRACRLVPPNLVDTSLVRILTDSLRPTDVLRGIRERRVRVVLAGYRFQRWPTLMADLARLFKRRYTFGDSILFLRPSPHVRQ